LQSELNGVYKSNPPPHSSPSQSLTFRVQRAPDCNPIGQFWLRLQRAFALLIATCTTFACFGAAAEAPYLPAEKPIKDEQGRVQVVIDFVDDAQFKYPGKFPVVPSKDSAIASNLVDFFHTEKSLALAADFEKRYSFRRSGMTSWVGTSITAMLTLDVIKGLRVDPLVKQISEDSYSSFSSPPVPCGSYGPPCVTNFPAWGNSSVGNEWTSYGWQALNGKVSIGNTGRKIYIIDGGVAVHDDLPTMARLNVACGSSGNCNKIDPYTYPLVGCYPHPTHIAGIIGSIAGNNKTIKGVYAGFPNMVSLSILKRTGTANCADTKIGTPNSASGFSAQGYALDYIAWDTTYNNPQKLVQIATMSINQAGVEYYNPGVPGPNWYKLKSLTTTIWAYGIPVTPGVFFVQSAGNIPDVPLGCSAAYRPDYGVNALPDDGVMVVGAAHHTGRAVSSAEPFSATYPANQTGLSTSSYSNYGGCVDVWAPGNAILSTWGIHVDVSFPPGTLSGVSYSGNVSGPIIFGNHASIPAPTRGWAFLSGTSMAAPFVAAAAAWLADTYGITSSSALETAVRNYSFQFNGNVDNAGYPVNIVQLPQ
jgi:Subtilase family